ncbi:hypothetical protein [Burkholderia ubonensis]|uniref:hypothetical protein n=1 Tax=Burkholderia ubonensis TaxID=101571 RepID=UPI0012F8C986|nr:hypothetical protein [Burkholderia ubonensis]
MMEKFDWDAPIEPGRKMLGLTLGLGISAVRKFLGGGGVYSHLVTDFHHSPRLVADCSKDGVILLRSKDMGDVIYDWQNVLARLVFEHDVLTSIIVQSREGGEAYRYKGKLLNKVGLGSPVADLLEIFPLEYDDIDEVFYSDEVAGLEVGGSSACDLSEDPFQVVTFIRIF